MTMAIAYHILRAAASIIGYYSPVGANFLRPFLDLTKSIAFMSWAFAFLPKKMHLALSNGLNNLENRNRIKNLQQVKSRLDYHLAQVKSGLPYSVISISETTGNGSSSARVQQALIDIQDKKLMLAFHLKRGYQSEDARQLLQLLENVVPNDTETDEILAAYTKIGKELRTR